jgi:hypothetical protein
MYLGELAGYVASSRATYNVVRVEASTGRVADDCCDCLDHGATKSTVGLHVRTCSLIYLYYQVRYSRSRDHPHS